MYEQRFKIGDPVEVVHDFRYGEWLHLPLWVVGVVYEVGAKDLNYHVAEAWPPRNSYDVTDGFREEDLMPRSVALDPIETVSP